MTKMVLGRLKPSTVAAHLIGGVGLPSALSITRASGGSSITPTGVLTQVNNNVARNSVTSGLLLEEARTNIQTASSAFVSTFSLKVDLNTSPVLAPDGSPATRIMVNADGGPNEGFLGKSNTVPNDSLTRTASAFIRKGNTSVSLFQMAYSNGTFIALTCFVTWGVRPEDRPALSIATAKLEYYGNGWWRISMPFANNTTGNTSLTVRVYVLDLGTITTGLYVDAFGFQVETNAYASSYIPTTTVAVTRAIESGTLAMSTIMPIYPSRNLVLFSEQMDNAAWVKSQITVTANAGTDPLGTATADKLIPDATANVHTLAQSGIATAAGRTATLSVFLKAVEYGFARILIRDGTTGTNQLSATINLTTGVLQASGSTGNVTNPSNSIVSVGSGWYRLSLTGTFATATTLIAEIAAQVDATVTTAGDGTSGILVWGAQLTLNAVPMSYIATTGAIAGGATKGTLIVDATYVNVVPAVTNSVVLSLYDDANNQLTILQNISVNKLTVVLTYGGLTIVDTQAAIPVNAVAGTKFRVAISWDSTTRLFAVQMNVGSGVSALSNTQVEFMPAMATMGLARNAAAFANNVLQINRLDFLRTPIAASRLATLIT